MGQTTYTWNAGNNDNIWSEPDNWDPIGIPGYSDHAIIANAAYDPEVTGTITVGSMEFTSGGHLDFVSGAVLEIRSGLTDLYNTGAFTNWDSDEGTVRFIGATNTSINGRFNFYKMEVDKDNGNYHVQIEDDAIVKIDHSLRMIDDGDIIAYLPDQKLILNSTYNSGSGDWETAYADFNYGLANGVFAGDLIVSQMFIDDFKTYHFLSSPVYNASYGGGNAYDTYDLYDDFNLGATWDDTWTWAPNPNFVPDFIYYNETEEDPNNPSGDVLEYGWQGSSTVTSSEYLTAIGEGVCARFRPKSVNSVLQPIRFSGAPNDGILYSPEMTNTSFSESADGLNLIGNPYCRPVSWQAAFDDYNGYFPEIWAWQNDATEYGGEYWLYDADTETGSYGWEGNIAIGQGFFVRARANLDQVLWKPSYCLNETNIKTFRKRIIENLVCLQVINQRTRDELLMHFSDTYSKEFLSDEDRLNGFNNSTRIQIQSNGKLVQFEKRPFTLVEDILPLYVSITHSGLTKIESGRNTLANGKMAIYLEDRLLKNFIPWNANSSYSFESQNLIMNDRFFLHILPAGTQPVMNPEGNVGTCYISNGKILFHANLTEQDERVKILDTMGKCIYSGKLKGINNTGIDISEQPSGIYHVEYSKNGINKVDKICKL